jgi:hypothetical protein
MAAGYSGTPLARKLSLKDDMQVWAEGMPETVAGEIRSAASVTFTAAPQPPLEAAHIFVTSRALLEARLRQLLPQLAPIGFVWVSWPKIASKVPTDITEGVIRDVALPMGLVDVKVCAVDETWSGLKLMIRRENR